MYTEGLLVRKGKLKTRKTAPLFRRPGNQIPKTFVVIALLWGIHDIYKYQVLRMDLDRTWRGKAKTVLIVRGDLGLSRPQRATPVISIRVQIIHKDISLNRSSRLRQFKTLLIQILGQKTETHRQ